MTAAAFPSPTVEMAEMNRLHYEMEYTEGINQRMRIPDRLKVAPSTLEHQEGALQEVPHSAMMQVPERIVVAGDDDGSHTRPRDLDLIQATPLQTLALKTPPRVLTLSDRPLDFLEMERSSAHQQGVETRPQGRSRLGKSSGEKGSAHQNGKLCRTGSLTGTSTADAISEGTPDDLALADATTLRRQIVKLNRRLQLLEEENKERAKREMVIYSITVAFWLVNGWVWFRR
uniref:Mitochondrial fission factor n=1 Tax=Paramormyrops kingsleyae TaxID=1676925 RepID=A0A3B3Q3Q5_9TELE|nr:mitochondrial fission factor homolog B-like isoform X2 [Paramormyrops kingsleyae]